MARSRDVTAQRVLEAEPVTSLDDYQRAGGGNGLAAGSKLGPAGVIEDVEASGLRGRGGAGFPTGVKWRTVAAHRSAEFPTAVVVNAAEGEPGTFKDRAILRANPYRVLEGAIIAAFAVGADRVLVGIKRSFRPEVERLQQAIAELQSVGWTDGIEMEVVEGPGEYLFGEETGLLEVLDGRPPLPRIAPPYRHGVDEVGDGSQSAAGVELAEGVESLAPPTLANNVETLANVPGIITEGPDWFRSVGTAQSPGTVVCTVTGRTARHGVGEVPMGTPLREVIERVGGGGRLRPGVGTRHEIVAVMSGVASPLVPAALLDTPASYEDMAAIGSGLGAAGFIVFDDETDMVAVALGVARFLGVESCGQCTPCKSDGLALAELFGRVCRSEASDDDTAEIDDRLATITDGARCYLAQQHHDVIRSIIRLFPDAVRDHVLGRADAVEPELIAPVVDIRGAPAILDETQAAKLPDWTYDTEWGGQTPAERFSTQS